MQEEILFLVYPELFVVPLVVPPIRTKYFSVRITFSDVKGSRDRLGCHKNELISRISTLFQIWRKLRR